MKNDKAKDAKVSSTYRRSGILATESLEPRRSFLAVSGSQDLRLSWEVVLVGYNHAHPHSCPENVADCPRVLLSLGSDILKLSFLASLRQAKVYLHAIRMSIFSRRSQKAL